MIKIIQKYTGFFRNIRVLHYIYNLLHRKGLKHNKHLYPYFEISNSVYSSISHKNFIGKKAKGKAIGVGTLAITILVNPVTTFLPGINLTLLVWK